MKYKRRLFNMATERIIQMAERSKKEDIYPQVIIPSYNREYMLKGKLMCNALRAKDYMNAQTVNLNEDDRFAGRIKFTDEQFTGIIFTRYGFKHYNELGDEFYKKPYNNLNSVDAQHSTPDYAGVLKSGLIGIKEKIRQSKECHLNEPSKIDYLNALDVVVDGMLDWENKCADACFEHALNASTPERKKELIEMGEILKKVPANPPSSFREAIQSLYFLFQFSADSIGTADRYLYKYYKKDVDSGAISRDEAKELLQELFVMINGWTAPGNAWTEDKGGESHFVIGGYDVDGNDVFNEFSVLILEALMELPTYRPQISFRWTEKTPRNTLKHILDCERKDTYKRIAFVGDRPRIDALVSICKVPKEKAVEYTMVGCNEIAVPGGMNYAAGPMNGCRCLDRLLHDKADQVISAQNFESFYKLFENELRADINEWCKNNDDVNLYYSQDVDIVSSILFDGPISNATPITSGGLNYGHVDMSIVGFVTIIDSLVVIKQFVYDNKIFTMQQMLDMLKANWKGYSAEKSIIERQAKYHGNNDPVSVNISQMLSRSLYDILADKRDIFGNPYLVGDYIGYCSYHAWFGKNVRATPDGRCDGDYISFGSGQNKGRDRDGLTSLMNSVSSIDVTGIMQGPIVFNINLEESMIKNEEYFEKTVCLIEQFFKNGGSHLQLNYVSKKDLLKAKQHPEDYKNLRVRVSGFSAYFTRLNTDLQDEIIQRTSVSE